MTKPERADAARNRARILEAAQQLFAEGDPRAVTMEDVARAAGVGRGTLYRRYPDTASIARALLGRHEEALQEQLLRGAPPLGPGAPPADRLAAFYGAMVDFLDRYGDLLLVVEAGARRFTAGVYGFWRSHVLVLLREAEAPAPEALCDVLLAPLAPEVFVLQRDRGVPCEDIKATLALLARRVLNSSP